MSAGGLDTILARTFDGLAANPADELAGERDRLSVAIPELDRKIRQTALHTINGMIDESDAMAITAPMTARRGHARLQLAALPAK